MATRDEVKKDISDAIDEQFPDNTELDADDLDIIESTIVPETLKQITESMDEAADEESESV